MTTFSTMHPPCFAVLGVSQVLLWTGALALVVLVGLAATFRYRFLVRLPLWILTHTFYRIRVHDVANVPATGPALLVSNHVSHIDALLILAATKRPVRFVVWAPFLGVPFLRVLLRLAHVIPIDSKGGPRAIVQSLRIAGEALAKGDIVCIFAEGGITRNGFMLPFRRGFEQIMKKAPAPIVPVYLDHVWGSIFSFQAGRFFWKWPRQLPLKIHVNFGKPLAADVDAFVVRQSIQQMSADSAIRRTPERLPVHRQFVRMAVRHPFRACVIDPSNTAKPILKYGETLVAAKILLRRLAPLLGQEKMVGVWLPPTTAGCLTNIVLAFLGKTCVNLNYTSAPDIIQSSLRQCGITKVISSRLFLHKVALDPGPGVEMIYVEDFRKSVTTWERIRTLAQVLLVPGFIQERWILGLKNHTHDKLLTIIFSSGSTGEPKGVMLTHGNIAANAESIIQAIDPGPKDCVFGILPFFHSFGYTVTLWVPLQVGARVLYYPNPLQAREIGELARTQAATIFLTTPTFLRSYLKRCEPADFASVRILMCGAEKLPQSLAKEFSTKFGVVPLEGYGCTELSPAAAANVPDWHEGNLRQQGNKPGTIGQPLPGVAARVVRRDTLESMPPGQEGPLLVRGANVMKGYLGKDELTTKKIVDGWYVTGDLASMDEDGFVSITGREERFAKVGGEMVPLEKVEDELQSILGESDRLLAVTAVPDAKKGERLIVLHLPLTTAKPQELWKRLTERGLPNIYIPSPRDFFEVAEIPILGSGKLDLKKCKQTAIQLAGNE